MCLILFSYNAHPRYRLVFAANRDEFYSRPTRPMGFWDDAPDVLAGVDLQCGGTWLGITRSGRMAAITNFRDPSSIKQDAPSRGFLVSDYLKGTQSPAAYLKTIQAAGPRYNGFNLIVGDSHGFFYYANRSGDIQEIQPGLHGLSNRLLDTPWPKVQKGKEHLARLLAGASPPDPESIFSLLADTTLPPDHLLPETGVGLEWERVLAPLFIESEDYGTRCATIVLWDKSGKIDVLERSFGPGKEAAGGGDTSGFTIQL